jgi:hypothetical protein
MTGWNSAERSFRVRSSGVPYCETSFTVADEFLLLIVEYLACLNQGVEFAKDE